MRGFEFESESGCKYFYDDNTGYIFPLNNAQDLDIYKKKFEAIEKICEYQPIDEVTVETVKQHLYENANGFRQLVLEVASGCNLRCKYCIYSEHYPTYKTKYMLH